MIKSSINRVFVTNVVVIKTNIEVRGTLPKEAVFEKIDSTYFVIIRYFSRSVDILIDSEEEIRFSY